MAAPLIGMDRDRFERIKAKAKQQLDDDDSRAACDAETMALQIAWLNRQYQPKQKQANNEGVYFALLNTPGMDIAAFPPHDVEEGFLFYQHHGGIWSVAYITRRGPTDKVFLFDGISTLARVPEDEEFFLRDDKERNNRQNRLVAAVETWLASIGRCINIPFLDTNVFSSRDIVDSGWLCLAWVEAKLRTWSMAITYLEGMNECGWYPATDNLVERAEMVMNGRCRWKKVLWLRANNARFEELAKA
ncbi:hypothetical protein VTK56DRAFT_6432 [Thermocarpiscus australiensis]